MNEIEQLAVLRRLVATGGKPFRMNGMIYWIENGIIYRDVETLEAIRNGQRIGYVDEDDYVLDNPAVSKERYNFTMAPAIREMLNEKYKANGFSSASEYLEYLIENARANEET